ncbi:hypothetical protein JOC48_002420 [Aquibacillus albus]|uniref:Uncharacterized protein n=1 Tax=Aquibacillus albus TaxID=1168171 RepID=A0ABS2N1D3_9BACI|nr:hypothetical protein [Aquibacillus albus]
MDGGWNALSKFAREGELCQADIVMNNLMELQTILSKLN